MLSVNGIDAYYGKVQALCDISITAEAGEIISIIGANGAGKSTLMNCIVGAVKARGGSIIFDNEDITQKSAHQITRKGIVLIPEGREVFPQMSVLENLEMGSYCKNRSRAELNAKLEEMYALFPRLKERSKQRAGSLSGGEQQMLAIARGLMSDPRLLMCDEPSLGLAPIIVDEMFDIFIEVNEKMGIPIIIVEQNAFMALHISRRCYVMENGRITAQGDSRDLIESEEIKKAYLGG